MRHFQIRKSFQISGQYAFIIMSVMLLACPSLLHAQGLPELNPPANGVPLLPADEVNSALPLQQPANWLEPIPAPEPIPAERNFADIQSNDGQAAKVEKSSSWRERLFGSSSSTPVKSTSAPPLSLQPQSTQSLELIRQVALHFIPHQYEDRDDWNKQKKVWAGVEVKREGLKLKTQRKEKEVNHGTWRRHTVDLLNPQKTFEASAEKCRRVTGWLATGGAGNLSYAEGLCATAGVAAWCQNL